MSVQPTWLFKQPTVPKAPVLDAEMMALIETIRTGLMRDGHVQLHQFGSFRLKWGKPRRWVNPRTGETGMSGPIPRVTFTPAKHLRELIEPAPKPARPLEEVPEEEIPTVSAQSFVPVMHPPKVSDAPAETELFVENVDDIKDLDDVNALENAKDLDDVNALNNVKDLDDVNALNSVKDLDNFNDLNNVKDLDDVNDLDEIEILGDVEDPGEVEILDDVEDSGEVEILDDVEDSGEVEILDDVEDLDIAVAEAMQEKSAKKGVRGWQLALLAAVPLIIMLLQSEFTGGNKAEATSDTQQAQVAMVEAVKPTEHMKQAGDVSDTQAQAQTNSAAGVTTEPNSSEPAGPVETAVADTTTPAVAESPTTAATSAPLPEDILYLEPRIHKVERGDNLWNLADEIFGDPYLWPYIYRANKGRLSDPDKLTVGMSLVVPGLQREPENLTENDSEHVAEGYYHLYRHYKSVQRKDAYFYLVGARRFSNDVLQSHQAEIDPADWDWATSVRIKAIRVNREGMDLAGN
jgi:nucleoid DNA-binding protein